MTVLDRPQPAAEVSLLWVLGTLLAAVLFAFGWVAAKTVLTVAWCVTAVRLGWDDAHRPGGG